MLVFVSHYPDRTHPADGMLQRVAAVDSLFADQPRLYLKISFWHDFRRHVQQVGIVRVEHVHFAVHYWHIRRCLQSASCVYVHSLFNFVRVMACGRLGDRLILDVHGVMPEELAFWGHPARSWLYQWIERRAVRCASLLVVVTEKMASYLLTKHPCDLDASRIVNLPLIQLGQDGDLPKKSARSAGGLHLVYAGSVLKWQNVDRVLEAAARLTRARSDTRVWLYVPEEAVRALEEQVRNLGVHGQVSVGCLPHDRLLEAYATMDAGFVLRDDHILNRVAMPMKLLEYLHYGVVPIVWNPDIGDLLDLGYRYLTLEDLLRPDDLRPERLEEMRRANTAVLARIEEAIARGSAAIRAFAIGSQAPQESLR